MKLYKKLQSIIENVITELKGLDFDFQPTPDNQPGDIGLACFRFAKAMKARPDDIAYHIAALDYPPLITGVTAIGPYVNFTLNRSEYAEEIIDEAEKGKKPFSSTRQ